MCQWNKWNNVYHKNPQLPLTSSVFPPQILCIHLKRFRHELMFSTKIGTHVSFPLEGLDLQSFLAKDGSAQTTNYDLLSVICHHGTASSKLAHLPCQCRRPAFISRRKNLHVLVRFVQIWRSLLPLVPGGHYIAYCRNDVNNLWYEFDDQSVTEVSESCVQNAEAYVLFYKYVFCSLLIVSFYHHLGYCFGFF